MSPIAKPGDVILVLHCEIYPTIEKAVAAAKELGLDTNETRLILRVKKITRWPP